MLTSALYLQNKESVRMLAWCRNDEYVAMCFNDGTMQVNFTKDHVKVNISSLHQSSIHVTFVSSVSLIYQFIVSFCKS